MSYLININEEQRLALIEVLKEAHPRHTNVPVQGLNKQPPLEYWITMLEELPGIEEQHKGIIHGFCL